MAAFRARLAKERQAKVERKPESTLGDKMLAELKAQVELEQKAEKERVRKLEQTQTKTRNGGHGLG